jgi:glyoxylase-like metal-dependent hydrolase (beta-lactamase superfamily II)
VLNDPPVVRPATLRQIAPGVSVIPDPRINYVPNIGIIEGTDAILVVDVGMGTENGRQVYDKAKQVAKGRHIYLTTTHFHPEHTTGASAFPTENYIINQAQADEIADKSQAYVDLFRSFGTVERDALEGVQVVNAGKTYSGRTQIDLGGRTVQLIETPAHSRGDQLVFEPQSRVLFTGDLIEDRFFPIMPDEDTKPSEWIAVTQTMLALQPQIVVPGHGNLGSAQMVEEVQDYLRHVRDAVYELTDQGQSQEAITRALTPKLKKLKADWDNAVFIPYQIAAFYAERTGKPLNLPDLSADLQSDAE